MKKLVVIHTTPATLGSIGALVGELFPGCQVSNLLDDSILPEINREGCITPGVRARLYTLLELAQTIRPDAILCACSSIGGVMEEGATFCTVPVLRIDGPMAENAVRESENIAVLATLSSTLDPTCDLLRRKAAAMGKEVCLCGDVIAGAGALLSAGKAEEYDRLVADAILTKLQTNAVVLLAQASMARCMHLIPEELRGRVFTSPRTGVAQLCNYGS